MLFVRNLLLELNMFKVSMTLATDSTSANSRAKRFGTSKTTRHAQLRFWFMQQLCNLGMVKISKVAGTCNPADLLTKYVTPAPLSQHLQTVGMTSRDVFMSAFFAEDFEGSTLHQHLLLL